MTIPKVGAVDSVSSSMKLKHQAVKYTGYGALALGIASGVVAKNKKIKLHTKLAYAAGILALVHTGLIEWMHCMKKKEQ